MQSWIDEGWFTHDLEIARTTTKAFDAGYFSFLSSAGMPASCRRCFTNARELPTSASYKGIVFKGFDGRAGDTNDVE